MESFGGVIKSRTKWSHGWFISIHFRIVTDRSSYSKWSGEREREIEIEMLLGNELIPKCLMHKPQAPFVVISSLVKVAFIMFKARLSLAEENMH